MSVSPPEALSGKHMAHVEHLKHELVDQCEKCNRFGWLAKDKKCECLKRVLYEYKLLCSNIPDTYQQAAFDQFVNPGNIGFKQILMYAKKINKMQENGLGLHIHNEKTGTGKTLLGVCVLLTAIQEEKWVWFTTMTRLLEDIRKGFNDQAQRKIIEWAMFDTDFLMIDELEKFNNTESGWLTDRLNDLIQTRVNYKKPIITTGNIGLNKLTDKYQEHLLSRLESRQIEVSVDPQIEYRRDVQSKEKYELLKEL